MSRSPNIALDATLWDESTTGIALYARELARALGEAGAEPQLLGAARTGGFPRGRQGRTGYALGQVRQDLKAANAQVFHAVCNFNLPLTRLPGVGYVLTVHDLIPELLPKTVSRAFHWQFRLWLSRSLQVAHQVVCVSQRTLDDLLDRYPFAAPYAQVIHHGADHVDRVRPLDAAGEDFLRARGLPERFLLYAGALDARKNVPLLLSALELLPAQGHTLVLMGQRWFGASEVDARLRALRRRGMNILELGYQPDAVFYAVLRRAQVLLYPSRYEGFGLPPLEAMRLGVPVLCSDAGALPEVCGDGAGLLPGEDPELWAREIGKLVSQPAVRAAAVEKGRTRAALYSWGKTAQRTLEVYRRAASEA